MPKYTKTATGVAQLSFATPKLPHDICISNLLPYEALVTAVNIKYIKAPRDEADAVWAQSIKDVQALREKHTRHLAAVKANATRKARKSESEAANV